TNSLEVSLKYKAMHKAWEQNGMDGYLQEGLRQSLPEGNPYRIATWYARLGNAEKALVYLQASFTNHHADIIGDKTDGTFRNLHSDPRFVELMRKMKFD